MTHQSSPCHGTAPASDESDAPGSQGLCLTSTRQGLCLPYKWTPAPCGVLGPTALIIKYLWSTLYFHTFHSTSLADPSFPCKVTACPPPPGRPAEEPWQGGGKGGLWDLHPPQRRPRLGLHAPQVSVSQSLLVPTSNMVLQILTTSCHQRGSRTDVRGHKHLSLQRGRARRWPAFPHFTFS